MRKYILHLVQFFIPILLFAAAWEMMLRSVPNSYRYKYEWMEKNAGNVEILIFGNSHAYYGIHPERLSGRAFSLANVSQDIVHDDFLLRYWADRCKSLKTVILPISYCSWPNERLTESTEPWRCRYYTLYMDCDLHPLLSKINMECLQWSTARSKTKRFLLRDKDCGCDSLGWGNDFTLDRKDTVRWNDGSEALEAAQRHTTMEQLHYVPYNYGMMQRMAQFCKQRGIRLVIITTPCCSEYNNNLDEKQLALMYKMTRKLCRENGLPYLDYLRDSRFTADDFFDSNHLSEIGAARFTDILDKDLQKLK